MVTATRPGSEREVCPYQNLSCEGLEGSEWLSGAEAAPEVLCRMQGLHSKSPAGAERSRAYLRQIALVMACCSVARLPPETLQEEAVIRSGGEIFTLP